ncbi:MAG TPA: Ig-like domain-containing protein, partial [Candidatus Paceibacterota bacterium]|nr:Ig-like domain-containing protein [Candidatus Paceibacterota bacterium]
MSADNTRSLQAGLEAILSGVATDDGMPSGEGLHVQWRLVEGPGEVFFNNASLAETHATCSEPGLYTFEFSASDSEFSSSFLVTIRMDMPPTVSFAPDGMPPIVRVGSTNGFSVTAADMDGTVDRVEFFANDMLLGVATPDANWWDRFYFNWIPQTNGVFQIRAVAYDNHGVSSASPEFAFEATYAPQITTEFPENDLAVPYGSTNVTFRAHALDPDGIVTNLAVYFISAYGNRQLIHQVANGEMDYTGPVEDGGTGCGYYSAHPVLFVATDDHGITTELPWQNIIFEPPNFIRNLLLPHAGETVMVGQHVDLLAEALISPPAQIKNFVFQKWVPGYWNYWWWIPEHWEMVGQAVSSAPFSTTWIPTIPGAYSIRAIASLDTDWCLYFESATNQIYVVPAYIGASIISPADGAEFTVKQTNVLALELYDPTGIFDHAEFFANSVSIGQTTNAIFNWAANATNNYVLSAKVYDRSGNFYASSNSVTVHVIPPPRPVVNITHPAGGSRIRANAESIIIASLDDPASITTNVQFFVDGTLAYQNSTYFAWTPTVLGTHTLRCVALTSDGDSVSSALVSVTVAEMYPPTVTISTPTNGQRFAFDALPTLGATATDSDGSISNLTLTLDFTVVGETNGGSLQVLTTNVTAGWHELLAQATDNDGLGAASPVVRFFIERGENLSLQIPDHLAAAAISATEIQLSWLSIATNELTQSVLIERWNVAGT